MFQKLLIANRGEIACRIARTARRLGVLTVAVYSEADKSALHVAQANEAYPIGPAPARESYLSMERIIDVAKRAGVDAIHPAYGFLSENVDFAERCAQSGVVFVGPSPKAMRLMGAKAPAKALMERIGVPIVPGFHADDPDDEALATAAASLGFPVLVKASAGGGGRGMRVVRARSEFYEAVAAARREARAAFGDDRLLVEKYLDRPRHVEVQIFGDAHGHVVAFRERDCSLQRHHQKVVEETPALGLDGRLRHALVEAACKAARAVDYVGAGTVEFLVEGEAFYFLEINTRLQVEHPVTEMVSDVDLVEWQLRVACGEPLPLKQDEIKVQGCAIEARICAEDPRRDFLPAAGVIEHFLAPADMDGVRIDTGVRRGDRVTPYYDSLLAKLVVHGADRLQAIQRLWRALDQFEIVGVTTNLDFLRALLRREAFAAGLYDVGYVERSMAELTGVAPPQDALILLAGACSAHLERLRALEWERAVAAGDPFSPWAAGDAWRIQGAGSHVFRFDYEGEKLSARITPLDGVYRMETDDAAAVIKSVRDGERMRLGVNGVESEVGVVWVSDGVVIIRDGRNYLLRNVDPLIPVNSSAVAADAMLSAPVPARVTRVMVKIGDLVKKGAPLVVLEAMKMEFTLAAPRDGVISDLRGTEGEMVREGERLIVLAEDVAA